MADGYVVLAPATPPDSSRPLAIFFKGTNINVDDAAALSRANAFKAASSPTASIQHCTVETYNSSIVITS